MSPQATATDLAWSENIALSLAARADADPHRTAVIIPRGENGQVRAKWSFGELNERSAAVAAGLRAIGLERGERAVLMVPPGLDFFALVFAFLRAGIVPVVVDPGIGLGSLKRTLDEAQPHAFIGSPRANAARVGLSWARGSIRSAVTTGRIAAAAGFTLREVARRGVTRPLREPIRAARGDPAAVLFTSGATGPPKGAVYTHAMFAAQIAALRDAYGIEPGEVDLCTFPLFALFAPALGMTAIVPPMDPTRPGRANPRKVLAAARDFAATNFFGSPALIQNVAAWGAEAGFRLPDLKRAISAGAPVPAAAIERLTRLLPAGAQVHTPYGATEALPVATIASREILGETRAATEQGRGVCVGRPVGGVEVEIIRITDEPIAAWSDELRAAPGEVGEIAVRGRLVTREYHGRADATRLAKIAVPAAGRGGDFLHRMGDLGWMDDRGRLWFCGRKSQRVETSAGRLLTIPCESVFNVHPGVRRTALVGVRLAGGIEPVICVETRARLPRGTRRRLALELGEIAGRFAHTRTIRRFLFHRGFPVDVRHNAKIGREKLGAWAARRLS